MEETYGRYKKWGHAMAKRVNRTFNKLQNFWAHLQEERKDCVKEKQIVHVVADIESLKLSKTCPSCP